MRDVYTLSAGLLQFVVDGFDAAGAELPEVRYVAPGNTVAFDGPQITVNLTNLGYGSPGADLGVPVPHAEYWVANLQVAIIRDVPGLDEQGNPPDPDELDAAAKLNMTDVRVLSEVLQTLRVSCIPGAGGLVDSPWMIAATEASPLGPEGGVAAAIATVQVSLL